MRLFAGIDLPWDLRHRIAALSEGRERAAFLMPFLTTQWREVLARAFANLAAEPDLWNHLLTTTDQLIWSTQHKRNSAERRQLISVLPGLVRQLNTSLDQLGWTGEERETFTRRLIATHMNAIRSTDDPAQDAPLDTHEQQSSEEAVLLLDQRLNAAQDRESDDFDEIARGFDRGMWFDFFNAQGQSHRCRLTWISPKRTRFLFTNREGFDAFVRSEREVTDLLRMGLLRQLSQEPIVARAIDQILAEPAGQV